MRRLACFLLVLATVVARAQSNRLEVTIDEGPHDHAAGTVPLRVTVANPTSFTAEALTLELFTSAIEKPVLNAPDWQCTSTLFVTCTHAPLAPRTQATFDFALRFPARAGRASASTTVRWQFGGTPQLVAFATRQVALIKPFVVSTTADDGEGTLRRAISEVNSDSVCAHEPCGISFAIDGAVANGWAAIAPLSPLPPLVARDVIVDATTQSDTNPLGPDVELLGVNVTSGHGLEIHAARAEARGLAIGGFPGNGIHYVPTERGSRFTFERNFIGVDPTGTRAVANGLRGITIEGDIISGSTIRDNVLSGNVRSGLFIATPIDPAIPLAPVLTITGNRIESNGASGIFFGPRAQQMLVKDNVIAGNGHFGVAIARGAIWVDVETNRISGNGIGGIDIGLDGPTDVEDTSYRGARATIESAVYDAATGTTIVTGRGPSPFGGFLSFTHVFYANTFVNADGYAQGEQVLGEVAGGADGRFTFRFSGDVRGKYINAVTRRTTNLDGSLLYDTSEFSRAVLVR